MLTAEENQGIHGQTRFPGLLGWLDAHPYTMLPLYLAVYIFAVAGPARRPLWYDELLTYYVSASGSVVELLGRIFPADLNPPLNYYLVSTSMYLFGHGAVAVRLPSMIAFLLAGGAVFAVVRRHLGGLFGLTAMTLVWSGFFFRFATEARPYALWLVFFAFALLCWDRLQPARRVTAAHWGLGASLAGMLLSHYLAALFVPPIVLGELARELRAKVFDRRAWAAILLPGLLVLSYVPLVTHSDALAVSYVYQISWDKAAAVYLTLLWSLGPVSFVMLSVLLVVRWRVEPATFGTRPALHETVFIVATLLMPSAFMLYAMLAKTPFYPRYCIGAVIGFSLGVVHLAAHKSNRTPAVGAVAAVVTLCTFCWQNLDSFKSYWRPPAGPDPFYRQIKSELPFVAASCLTFLEMDHREPAEFVGRLFYLSDHEAAMRYVHADTCAGMPAISRYFPIRARTMSYRDFIRAQHHFLVLARPGYPEDWLIDQLKDDGADIRLVSEKVTNYRNGMLFEVWLSGVKNEFPAHTGQKDIPGAGS